MNKKLNSLLLFISLLFTSISGYAFNDSDLDGVEDSFDRCPDTPFDVLVNQYGCPIEKKKSYTIYLRTGPGYTDSNGYYNYLWNFSVGFLYRKIYLSLSTNYYIYDSILDKDALGDTYFYGSYTFNLKKLYIYPGITVKIPTATDNLGDGKFDYTPSLYLDYIFNSLDLFVYYGFIFRGNNQFDDTYTTSIGLGYQLDKFYLSGSYDFNGDSSKYVSIFSSFDLTKKYYLLFNYSYGLNQQSIKHFVSLKVGVRL